MRRLGRVRVSERAQHGLRLELERTKVGRGAVVGQADVHTFVNEIAAGDEPGETVVGQAAVGFTRRAVLLGAHFTPFPDAAGKPAGAVKAAEFDTLISGPVLLENQVPPLTVVSTPSE